MRAKNIEILADFRRDLINSKCSEKPVKSRPFRDFKGVKNALRGLLLRVSCEFDSRRGRQKHSRKALIILGFSVVSFWRVFKKLLNREYSRRIHFINRILYFEPQQNIAI